MTQNIAESRVGKAQGLMEKNRIDATMMRTQYSFTYSAGTREEKQSEKLACFRRDLWEVQNGR